MSSHTTAGFRKALAALPPEVRRQARAAYRQFAADPYHSSLRFGRVHTSEPIYSARIGLHYRAVGVVAGDTVVWYWIGSHAEYDALLKRP